MLSMPVTSLRAAPRTATNVMVALATRRRPACAVIAVSQYRASSARALAEAGERLPLRPHQVRVEQQARLQPERIVDAAREAARGDGQRLAHRRRHDGGGGGGRRRDDSALNEDHARVVENLEADGGLRAP